MNRRSFLQLSGLTLASTAFSACVLNADPTTSLIITVAPSRADSYYDQYFDALLESRLRLVEAAHPNDHVLVVVPPSSRYIAEGIIPPENLVIGDIPDIWVRDFAPLNTPKGLFKAQYQPSYRSRPDIAHTDNRFDAWLKSAEIHPNPLDLILDGGNYRFNGIDKAILTDRVLHDNPIFSSAGLIGKLQNELGLSQIAIIPQDPEDRTGHSNNMVQWLGPDKLGIASLSDPLYAQIVNACKRAFPSTELIPMPHFPTYQYWHDFPSASGMYVNALTTPHAIYLPIFGQEADEIAFTKVVEQADRPVLPIAVGSEAAMGSNINNTTWQLSGILAGQLVQQLT
ncbi:MAG: agmatine deiminase family protein [Candidatus Promineifilaceae bacterium]